MPNQLKLASLFALNLAIGIAAFGLSPDHAAAQPDAGIGDAAAYCGNWVLEPWEDCECNLEVFIGLGADGVTRPPPPCCDCATCTFFGRSHECR